RRRPPPRPPLRRNDLHELLPALRDGSRRNGLHHARDAAQRPRHPAKEQDLPRAARPDVPPPGARFARAQRPDFPRPHRTIYRSLAGPRRAVAFRAWRNYLPPGRARRQLLSDAAWLCESVGGLSRRRTRTGLRLARRLFWRNRIARRGRA